MKINSTANFSQIRQQVPHTGTSGFEPQLVTHEKICTSLENDQCSNTEHQTKPNHSCILHEIKQYQLLHCVQTVLLSVSLLVFHTEPKTVTAEWCFICSIYVDFMWC